MLLKPSSCKGCPLYGPPWGKPAGFSEPWGTAETLVVAEALGVDEEKEGMALVGKTGYALFQKLREVEIERDQFTLFNTIACRPPDNKLTGMPYEDNAIRHCAPNLDRCIEDTRERARQAGKTFVIIALGIIPFRRLLGLDRRDPILREDSWAYPFWSDQYKAWIYHCPHPSHIVRGKTYLWPIVQFIFKRALDVASSGLQLEQHDYLLDPSPEQFHQWTELFKRQLLNDPEVVLSYDIETPYKQHKAEEELAKEEPADHTIIRCSFCYRPNEAVSVRWAAEYMADIESLFGSGTAVLGWNSDLYDKPRVARYTPIAGPSIDAMVAWHVLNTSLPKGLGFVTPYNVQNTAMWKHLSDSSPALYNAKDADMALRNYIATRETMKEQRQWHVFDRHVLRLNEPLNYMTSTGLLRDNEKRDQAEKDLSAQLDGIEARMESAVPLDARNLKVYKKKPKREIAGLRESVRKFPVKYCAYCGLQKPNKAHAKHCVDYVTPKIELIEEPQIVWEEPMEFKISVKGLTAYQKSLKHQAIVDRKEKRVTFNADAITILAKKYPDDPLYPAILEHRKLQKLLSTYVGQTEDGRLYGGMQIGPDGRIHCTYTHNPSTLRLACEDPNMQNLPRPNPKDADDPVNIIRNLIIAAPGHVLYARDYSGIEAVLTGYFAMDPRYVRLARVDVHTYYTVYALHELDGRIKSADLPDINWPDDRLFPYLEQLKSEFKQQRNSLYKHLVHAANFMQGAKGAQEKIFSETGINYPVKTVQKVMDIYYALFPSIPKWHRATLEEADETKQLRNPFDYVHRFAAAYEWKWECGQWTPKPGPDANKAIAFKPQSTAAAIIKEALMRLYFDRFDEAGRYLRLQVHDELLSEVPREQVDTLDAITREEMERPIPQLRIPASWNMGDFLTVLTEAKVDYNETSRWGSMKGIPNR